jgi:hypothetical protein
MYVIKRPPQEYKAVFEQLVLEECGALVLRGVEEGEVLEPHPSVVARSYKVGGGLGIAWVACAVCCVVWCCMLGCEMSSNVSAGADCGRPQTPKPSQHPPHPHN